MTGRRTGRKVSRLQLAAGVLFLAGAIALFAGAGLQATGTALLIVLYLSLTLIAAAALLIVIDWLRRRFNIGARKQ